VRYRFRSADADIALTGGRFFIGRARECQLVLDDPLVSRRHAVVFTDGDGSRLEDLGSRNGTLVNGERIEGSVELADGDRVTIGAHSFLLAVGEDERQRKATLGQGFPSGAYERPPATMRPPSPVVDEVTRSVSIFGMLVATCERALARGDLKEAESAAANLAVSLRAELLRGRDLDPHVMNELVGFCLDLAGQTGSVRWIDRVFEIYGAAQEVIDAETIDRIHLVVIAQGFSVGQSIEGYLTRLQPRDGSLDEDEERRIHRVVELAG